MFTIRNSVLQAPHRHDIHAIASAISIISGSGQNHKKRWHVHLVSIDFCFHCFQTPCAFFNELIPAELNFNQTLFAVSQMDNSIAFLPVFVPVMVDLAV